MKTVVSQIIISNFSSRVDGSLGFRASTPELTVPEKIAFMELQGKNCRALFEPLDYASDGKTEIKNPLGTKSPSVRLRSVLFVLFKQLSDKGKVQGTFDEFYVLHMDRIIDGYKEQLEPES